MQSFTVNCVALSEWVMLNTKRKLWRLKEVVHHESKLSFVFDIQYLRVWKCYSFWSPHCTCEKQKADGIMSEELVILHLKTFRVTTSTDTLGLTLEVRSSILQPPFSCFVFLLPFSLGFPFFPMLYCVSKEPRKSRNSNLSTPDFSKRRSRQLTAGTRHSYYTSHRVTNHTSVAWLKVQRHVSDLSMLLIEDNR